MLLNVVSFVLAAAAGGAASPVLNDVSGRSLAVHSAATDTHLEKRLSTEFDLDHQWDHELLFGGTWSHVGLGDVGTGGDSASLYVTCVECWTKGTVTASLTTEDIIEPVVRLSFAGVEAYVDVDVRTSASATYAITLFSTESPVGINLPDLDIGLVFSLDLVFSVSAMVELDGGFYVQIPDGAYLDTDLFSAGILDSFFEGIRTKSIPVTVHSGAATFQADLRLRVQCGAEADLDIFGIGAGAMVGIYANLLEFVAVLDASTSSSCELESREWFDVNVGAYAVLDVEVDYKTFSAVPTISTTLYDSPTFTQCWIGSLPAATGYTATTASSSSGYVSVASVGEPYPTSSGYVSVASVGQPYPTGSGYLSAASSGGPYPTTSAYATSAPGASGYGGGSSAASAGGSTTSRSNATTTQSVHLVTSTVYTTTEYTITSCAATVVNCPASLTTEIVVTSTIDVFTTVCPYGATVTPPAPTTTAAPQSSSVTTLYITTTDLITIPKVSPVVKTFAPSSASATAVKQQITSAAPALAASTAPPAAVNDYVAPTLTNYLYQNTTATLAPSFSTSIAPMYATSATSTALPSMPVQGTGNSLAVTRLRGALAACAFIAGIAVFM